MTTGRSLVLSGSSVGESERWRSWARWLLRAGRGSQGGDARSWLHDRHIARRRRHVPRKCWKTEPGEEITGFGPAGEKKLDLRARTLLEAAIKDALRLKEGDPTPQSFGIAAAAVAAEHVAAGEAFMAEHRLLPSDLDVIGLQGQTVLHAPPGPGRSAGRTIQLIDAPAVAAGLGVPVVYDLRQEDIAAGGQGAPLAPVYHGALVRYFGPAPAT